MRYRDHGDIVMERLAFRLDNKSPFSIAASRAISNVQESLDFIPGTLVRGALAAKWLRGGKPDNDFKDIFTGDKVAFGNLFIQGAKPVPLSAFSCKYHSGFKGDQHGIRDILLSLIKEIENKIQIPDEYQRCTYLEDGKPCHAPMKKFGGYYLKDISKASFNSKNVEKRLIFHTALSHITETALEGALYSQEVVEDGQNFRGEIWIYDSALQKKLFDFIKKQDFIHIGSDKSIGLGKFEISLDMINEIIDKKKIQSRILEFNKRLGINNGKTYFSITLQSDAIITDRFQRYKTFIESEDMGIQNAEPVHGIARSRLIQGWNAMARIPKEDAIAIEKGSVFVFSANNQNDLIDGLYNAEVNGIGRRKGEGFGRLTVCDPFHIQEGMI
jgi:CRISPR-associated protein Csx10